MSGRANTHASLRGLRLVSDGMVFNLADVFRGTNTIRLGRNADQCDIRIPARDRIKKSPDTPHSGSLLTVSRVHARIVLMDSGQLRLEDNQSVNGVFVNRCNLPFSFPF